MDSRQFEEFMTLQQAMIRQLAQIHINYVTMRNVANEKKYCAKLLLNSIGAKKFQHDISPKAPTDLEYDELLKMIESHLSPKKNKLVAQHKFLLKYQNETQSIAEFVATLRMDIDECEFVSPCACNNSIANVFLKVQFIRGINNNSIREQLLLEDSSTFEEIVEKALVLEAARADAKEITNLKKSEATYRILDSNSYSKRYYAKVFIEGTEFELEVDSGSAYTFLPNIGCIPNYKVSLKLRDNVTPVYTKERQIPFALTERVNEELENLENAGIITKIDNSDWGSPLVVIPKADGGVRLCVDYKVGVNQRLVNALIKN
ncbi:Uncharacterized protein K02A2.6 [Eumeta japonica]|uniref:Uncharacterized protein K02A2.6 n=1 Tax=Eumeta variegata TaxID=151549 RepID=A0A4C1SEG1_EUMVA|nr:Uncharacterized protein K02A2.6 [Eumeta japonica]